MRFEIRTGKGGPSVDGTVGRTGATCIACQSPVDLAYIRTEGKAHRIDAQLMAVVAEGSRQRVYLPATEEHVERAQQGEPHDIPETDLPQQALGFRVQAYGMTRHRDLFTDRQLTALTALSDLVGEARDRVASDAKKARFAAEDAESYARDTSLYLSFVVDRLANESSTLCTWDSNGTKQHVRATFSRQALSMTWDYAEGQPFTTSTGSVSESVRRVADVVDRAAAQPPGFVAQTDASSNDLEAGLCVSTDPPYYDNIGYADLADFFYIWLRRSLASTFPEVTATMLTPKAEELVANPFLHGGREKAEEHFERGFVRTFTRIREKHAADLPITVFYAFKQSESDEAGTASTGWETMLQGLIEAGLTITATWPIRTERSGRSRDIGSNALASSIVLACRPRPESAEATTRRGFIAALKGSLPGALRELQQGSVAPVDLAQAAIGPGMAVYSRYSRVVEADGSEMSVRTALALINQVLDETLSEQEGDFDADTRFCLKWFSQYQWNEADSGTADVLARATNTSTEGLQRGGVFRAVAGKARLIAPEDLRENWDPSTDLRTSVWEVTLHLAKAVSERGADAAAALMATAGQRVDLDVVKELAYLLYSICERRGWTSSALLFNGLGTSWIDLDAAARSAALKPASVQGTFDYDTGNDE